MSQYPQQRSANSNTEKPKFLTLYQVDDYSKDGETQSSFTKLGVAFFNKNPDSFTLHLNAAPMTGNILMRPAFSRANGNEFARRNPSQNPPRKAA